MNVILLVFLACVACSILSSINTSGLCGVIPFCQTGTSLSSSAVSIITLMALFNTQTNLNK